MKHLLFKACLGILLLTAYCVLLGTLNNSSINSLPYSKISFLVEVYPLLTYDIVFLRTIFHLKPSTRGNTLTNQWAMIESAKAICAISYCASPASYQVNCHVLTSDITCSYFPFPFFWPPQVSGHRRAQRALPVCGVWCVWLAGD